MNTHTLIITEKPSVAQSIAAALGVTETKGGYMLGADCIISWCLGHLVELAHPHLYDARYAKWRWEDLPLLPNPWATMVCDSTRKQFEVLKRLMHDPTVDTVVCATDAGREGELIFRLVYEKAGCQKPVKRLWISSLEESAIHEGFRALRDGRDYDNLYRAALCRAQADWLVGINATRLFSLLYGTTLNVGRVMSPTLALIVQREAEIAFFQSEPFYTVQMSCSLLATTPRMKEKADAERIAQQCNLKTAVVKNIDKKRKTEKPPALYDLTSLQRKANRLFGYTAQQTLDYAQALYEKRLLTYPRTDSRFLTGDMAVSLPNLVQAVSGAFPFTAGLNLAMNAERVINDSKVTDHHALLPTKSMPHSDLMALPAGERDILTLVAVRLLCAVGDDYVYDETTVTLECENVTFTGKGKTVVQMGWKIPEATFSGSMGGRINQEQVEKDYPIPALAVGQMLSPVMTKLKEGKTTPPKHHTEDSLLSAMEAAGAKDAPDDAEHKGLGTPATRAGILEKLIQTGFAERKGDKRTKHLLPTTKGKALITILPEMLQSPLLTAEWEQRLKQIERGEADPEAFLQDIQEMIVHLLKTAKPVKGAPALFPSERVSVGACPLCGMAVTETPKGFFCSSHACRFGIWKDHSFFAARGIKLDARMISALLRDGRVHMKNLRSQKTGKQYDATIIMDSSKGVRFSLEFSHR